MKFPRVIHVSLEEAVNEGEYLSVRENGIADEDLFDGQPVAVYKLVSVGQAVVRRTYQPKKRQPKEAK